jgi:NEDD8-activating enzyme E1
MIREYLEV